MPGRLRGPVLLSPHVSGLDLAALEIGAVGYLLKPFSPAALVIEVSAGLITEASGSHFDPELVDAFLEIRDEIEAIAAARPDRTSRRERPR
ncbi:MAG: hypothetical protein ACR2H3_05770 [Acidimicrobiales bacterium]